MKKIALVVVLAALVAVGSVFADHPDGWAVGPGFQAGTSWNSVKDSDVDVIGSSSFTVFFKAPQLPIYWGAAVGIFDIDNDYFWLRATGDYYFIDKTLVPDINLGWFLGGGGYFQFGTSFNEYVKFTLLDFGGRLPIGLSWMPIDWLEVFIDIAPSIGLQVVLPEEGDSDMDLGGGIWFDLGVRFWF